MIRRIPTSSFRNSAPRIVSTKGSTKKIAMALARGISRIAVKNSQVASNNEAARTKCSPIDRRSGRAKFPISTASGASRTICNKKRAVIICAAGTSAGVALAKASIKGASRQNPTMYRIPRSVRSLVTGSSAVRDVHSEAPQRGLFVFFTHVMACLAHRFNTSVQRHQMFAVAAHGKAGGADGLDRA